MGFNSGFKGLSDTYVATLSGIDHYKIWPFCMQIMCATLHKSPAGLNVVHNNLVT